MPTQNSILNKTLGTSRVNFTLPNNFIKLYVHKIKVDEQTYTLAEFVYTMLYNYPPKNRKEFIGGVIEVLLGAEYTSDNGITWERDIEVYFDNPKDLKKIIKSLQEEQWE